MSILAGALERAHEAIGQAIDRAFTASHCNDEIAIWDKHWKSRLAFAQRTGRIFEHHTPGKRWLYERVIDAIERCAGGSVAGKVVGEFGCGSGYATIRMVERGANPVLIDASESALQYARHVAEQLRVGKRVTFQQSDLIDGHSLGPFDVCFNSGVLEHYPLDVAACMLQSMVRATRPGGIVVVILPNLLAPALFSRMLRDRSKGSEKFYTPWLLGRVFMRAGLMRSRAGYVNAILPVKTPNVMLEISRRLCSECWAGPLSALFFRCSVVPESAG